MNSISSGKDGFWARVRAALGRGDEGADATGRKMLPPQRIDEELRKGWHEAAEHKVSLCVLALEMDLYAEYFAAYGAEAVEESLVTLEAAINAVLPRYGDLCVRGEQAGFVIVLPDMPRLMARELTSRIAVAVRRQGLAHRGSHAGHVTLSMGLCVVNPQGPLDRSVLSGATEAVEKAQRRGIGRLEIVDYRGMDEKRAKAA